MGSIKFFDLIEESFLAMTKTTKKIWIIGMIISILSGGLIIQETGDYDLESDKTYDQEYYTDTEDLSGLYEPEATSDMLGLVVGSIVVFVLLFMVILALIVFVAGLLSNIAIYYLYYELNKVLFNEDIERAPLGLVVKVNAIVLLKVIGGLILFIVPGIIIGLKYLPVNYVICKKPQLSSKEILSETRLLSKGFKWKMLWYNLAMLIIGSVLILLCSPDVYITGSVLINIIGMLVTFVIVTFISVYSGIFNMNLYKSMDNIKIKLGLYN